MKPDVIIICGPTGVGKTSSAIKLAQEFNGEIISADSMQIYRHMDIGTAKPTHEEQSCIPHHMIDIVDPDESFDAACFSEMARNTIGDIHSRNRIPFVVGGTGLYIKAMLHGLFRIHPVDKESRELLKEEERAHGSVHLHNRLKQCDPKAAEKIHPNDLFRIIRALEIYQSTGEPLSRFHRNHGFKDQPFNSLQICLSIEREKLYDRINQRVDEMIQAGFADEVKGLFKMGYSENLKSMKSIGYRHISSFIKGELPWDETVYTLKRDTRRFAKRQLTWFRADEAIKWFEPDKLKDIRGLIKQFLE